MSQHRFCEHCGSGPICCVCDRDEQLTSVRVAAADWPIVKRYLDQLGRGGILVPPGHLADECLSAEAGTWLDVARSVSGYTAVAIIPPLEEASHGPRSDTK